MDWVLYPGKYLYSIEQQAREAIMLLAYAVLRGDYGDGPERKKLLGDLYDPVQEKVNYILTNDPLWDDNDE